MYRQLDAQKIVETTRSLRNRIAERFPDSGLSRVAGEVETVSRETVEKLQWIQRPQIAVRASIYLLLAGIVGIVIALVVSLRIPRVEDISSFIQLLEAGLSAIFFIGAGAIFLVTLEARIKRNRALKTIHELRAMAHIVDMHQLTKDPEAVVATSPNTASSPVRSIKPSELGRYLDYCSELLSLISKIAALYAQSIEDPVVLNAVDDVEDLTTELSQKMWQKITLLDSLRSHPRATSGAE